MLQEQISRAGVVGAGGAGFPSAFKLAEGIETVLINGVECEPLLKTDFHLYAAQRAFLEGTLETVVEQSGAKEGVLAIKRHAAELLGISAHSFGKSCRYTVIDNIYPAGDELVLIEEALGKTVGSGKLPISQGVVVYNLETLYNIGNAMAGKPVTEKFVTIAGRTEKTTVLKVPVGTSLSYLLEQADLTLTEEDAIIEGGPMMGKLSGADAVVTKTAKGYLILPKDSSVVMRRKLNQRVALSRAASACCGCRMCTDLCPRHLLGHDIEPHKIVKTVAQGIQNTKVFQGAFLCSSCSVCDTIACCQGLSPRMVFAGVKGELAKQGMRPEPKDVKPRQERTFRRVPTQRILRRLGVWQYDRDDYTYLEPPRPQEVEIPLRQHIGGLYPLAVKVGDRVKTGDPLTAQGEGLGALIHASIDGTVTEITEKAVKIVESNRSH
ncbi:MAG: hypothetical protein HFI90_08270 [Clostridia bacterium]|nr:hypothetical protein [Clostridia bacterium]